MQTVIATIEGVTPYSQSKFFDVEKLGGKETHEDHEKRCWQKRIHVNEAGDPYMPPMALKKALEGASSYLGKIPGERNATYVKRFKSGIIIADEIALTKGGRKAVFADFEGEWLFLDATGKAGGTRVKRCMPRIVGWAATATIHIVDEVVTQSVLAKALTDAGMLVGVGRFRPSVGGFYGRFKLVDLKLA